MLLRQRPAQSRLPALLTLLLLLILLAAALRSNIGLSPHTASEPHVLLRHGTPTGAGAAAAGDQVPAAGPIPLKFPIWWAAPFYSGSGYSNEAISYVLGLAQGLVRPQDLWLSASGGNRVDNVNSPELLQLLSNLEYNHQKQVLTASELQRPAIVICHSFPDFWEHPGEATYPEAEGSPCPTAEMKGRYVYRVGRTMFETDRLQQHLADHVREFDEVWVPTEFNRETFSQSGINASKIFVLPESINLTEFDPGRYGPSSLSTMPGNSLAIGSPRAAGKEGQPFVFLSIFKWETRKGWEILLKAFLEEFKADEDVELHIVTHAFMEQVQDWGRKVQLGAAERAGFSASTDWAALPRVFVSANNIADEYFPKLYKASDALVIPTRGEGWGRPQMEAMAMELPVISTNWSGLTSFLNGDTGYPIHVEQLVEAKADGPTFFGYFAGTKWAQPNGTHLRQLMRHVVSHREEARAKGKAARRYLQDHFSPAAVAAILHRLVLDVQGRAEAHVRAAGPGPEAAKQAKGLSL